LVIENSWWLMALHIHVQKIKLVTVKIYYVGKERGEEKI